MGVAERAAGRSLEGAKQRADAEVRALVDAGLAALRRSGSDGLTVADVLAEAGLSTRAFYRHFTGKDELVLAVFEREYERSAERLRAAVEQAPDARAAVEAWVDETLALAFEPRRARRTAVLLREGERLRATFPAEFDAIVAGTVAPLAAALDTEHPERDARAVRAVAWDVAEAKLSGAAPDLDLATARAHVLRFCLAGLGLE